MKPLPFAADALEPALSRDVVAWHHDTHEQGYVAKRNEIEAELAALDPATVDPGRFGELKRKEAFNASGQILHEVYWSALGGNGQPPTGAVAAALDRDFGSFAAWQTDFTATARAALGWAVLAFDPSDGRLHDYLVDYHHHGAVWGAVPLVAIDVWEHAYYRDRGPDRDGYIAAFLERLDWDAVSARYTRCVAPLL